MSCLLEYQFIDFMHMFDLSSYGLVLNNLLPYHTTSPLLLISIHTFNKEYYIHGAALNSSHSLACVCSW